MKIDWKKKLTSRKWWVAMGAMVSGLILIFGGSESTAEMVCGTLMNVAAVIAYTIGEGLADASHKDESAESGDEDGI